MELRLLLAYALIAAILGIVAVWGWLGWRAWKRERKIQRDFWRRPRD